MAKVVDTFSYNGEPIVELRLEYLAEVVDLFVIVEARYTHAGDKKDSLYIEKHASVFAPYKDKIQFLVIDEFPSMPEEWPEKFGESYMTPQSYEAWYRERYQRDKAGEYLLDKYKNDLYIVIASDADEIVRKDIVANLKSEYFAFRDPVYLGMKFYYYHFQWRKKFPWYHAFIINDLGLAKHSLSHCRTNAKKARVIHEAGWHASYFFNWKDLQRKLESFAHRECDQKNHKDVSFIRACIQRGKDISERGDEEDLIFESVQGLPPIFQEFQRKLLFLQEYS